MEEQLQTRWTQQNYTSHEALGQLGAGVFSQAPGSGGSKEEPMQLGSSHLSAAKREHRILAGECLYCSRKGHVVATCPSRAKVRARQ